MSHSTQSRSFWRRSSQPISLGLVPKNTTKANNTRTKWQKTRKKQHKPTVNRRNWCVCISLCTNEGNNSAQNISDYLSFYPPENWSDVVNCPENGKEKLTNLYSQLAFSENNDIWILWSMGIQICCKMYYVWWFYMVNMHYTRAVDKEKFRYQKSRNLSTGLYSLNIIRTKLESVSLSCKSHRSKTANIKILSANSTHRC